MCALREYFGVEPNAKLTYCFHSYGPTEASTNCVALTHVATSTQGSNIGRPFGLNAIYVLDERRRPVPLGCVGELFIGGPQVARGYLKNPEQTAKVFVDNPFRPGSTMYATGDLVRMNPVDGSITYLGRRDTQIKIRGLRVEIGEIEVVLKTSSQLITNAVVIKVELGRESLVAFLEYPSNSKTEDIHIVYDDGLGPLLTSLKRSVRQKLPTYMAPATYVALNRFPLTSSGKLDRKALDAYFYSHETVIQEMATRVEGDFLADYNTADLASTLQTELQATVRSLWASVLHIREGLLHIDDDFYTAGGDSILAIRLASAAREAGLHLLATDIIRNPTIRAMAEIATSSAIDHDFDDDDIPSMNLSQMKPLDLTLLDLDQDELDVLRNDLLPQHGLSARLVPTLFVRSLY